MKLNLFKNTPAPAVCAKDVKQISRVFQTYHWNNMDINLVVVSDPEIKQINQQYRQKNEVTDVLSFRLDDKNAEIYIAYAHARKQARQRSISIKQEIQRLTFHGLLHIIGYDHIKKNQARKMQQLEDKLLMKI